MTQVVEAPAQASQAAPETPYVGLTPFTEGDAPFFFGREKERRLIAANLLASRLTLLYGASGVGKSSVLRAGIQRDSRARAEDALASGRYPQSIVVVFTGWRDDPIAGLADCLAGSIREILGDLAPEPPPDNLPLDELLLDWTRRLDECARDLIGPSEFGAPIRTELLVVFDQFEQYFVYHPDEDGPGTFALEFPRAVNRDELRANFLISLREDAYTMLDRFEGRITNLFASNFRLEHLDEKAATAAIVKPVETYNTLLTPGVPPYSLEPELVEAVIKDVRAGNIVFSQAGSGVVEHAEPGQTRVETPFLQLVMSRLWAEEQRQGSHVLRLDTLRSLGGAERIVRRHLDEAMSALDGSEREVAARMFHQLVTPSGTRIVHSARDLAGYADVSVEAAEPILEKLDERRILRTIDAAPGERTSRFEIRHDVLAVAVVEWVRQYEERRRQSDDEARQRRELEEERRRLRIRMLIALAIVAAFLIPAVVGGVYVWNARSDARAQARSAGARALEASALSQLTVDPELSLLLAVEAGKREAGPRAEDVLRRSLLGSRERGIFRTRGPVAIASFSPDRKRALVAGERGDARLIELPEGRTVVTLANHKPITSGGFSRDGRLIVTAGNGGARIWSARNGGLIAALRVGAPARTASFDRSGDRIVVTGGRTVAAWKIAGKTRLFLHRLSWPVTGALFSPDGELVAVFGNDHRVLLYKTASGVLMRTFDQGSFVRDAAFSPDGTLLATAGDDPVVHLWDVATGRKRADLVGHSRAVVAVTFNANGSRIATSSLDGSGRIWTSAGALIAPLGGHQHFVTDVAFSPDGTLLATASSDRTARVWTVSGEPVALLAGHSNGVTHVTFSPDSRSVLTASDDGTARIWDPRTQPRFRVLTKGRGALRSASYLGPGRLILTAGPGNEALLVRASDGALVRTLRVRGDVVAAAASPSGSRIAVAAGRRVTIFDRVGKTIRRLVQPAGVSAVAISSAGESVATGGADGIGRVWRLARRTPPLLLKGHTRSITDVAFSPNDSAVATASRDKSARLWDARTGAQLRVLTVRQGDVNAVAFSPDGRMLLSANKDADVRLWDAHTGSPEQLLRWHFGPVADASFSPDGRWIATAGPVTVQLWQPGVRAPLLPRGIAAPERPSSVAFDSTSRTILAAGSSDGALLTYHCGLCGGLDELTALAEARLASTGRTLSAAERRRYGG
jgi:WD40 repeat protein